MAQDRPSLDDLRIERRDNTGGRSRGWLALVLVLLIGAGAAYWWLATPKTLRVQTATARESTARAADRVILNASGYVTARREATVSSKVTGKVVEVLVEEGMAVTNRQVLARLDDTNVRAGLRLAEAHFQAAQATLEETKVRIKEAELNLKRVHDLARNSITAQADVDRAEAEANSLKARLSQQESQVTVAEREVAGWQQQLDDTVIRAPFGGIVTSKNAQPGEMISPVSAGGGFTRTGICTIVDMDSLEVEVDVNESYINRVRPGQSVEATLDAYPEWKIPCKVIATIPTADRQKSTVRVRVGFEKLDPRILPQMSIKVAFRETNGAGADLAVAQHEVLLPRDAVQNQDGKDIAYVVRNQRAERRAVKTAGLRGGEVVTLAGVSAGEKVVVNWPKGLVDGARIRESDAPAKGKL